MRQPLVIVGCPDEAHVGAHLLRAARRMGIPASIVDSRAAFEGPRLLRAASWRLLSRRPPRLRRFGALVEEAVARSGATTVIVTGITPPDADGLHRLGRRGVRLVNFLTDDPWNPAHRASWFLETLRAYDHVFSPRRAVLPDLENVGCRVSSYLPFAYCPEVHRPGSVAEPAFDVFFAGGADPDRVPLMSAIASAGFSIALFGGYWERHRELRAAAMGLGDLGQLRAAAARSKVGLVLVRRANRDGNSMRTFEVPAMGLCPLVEDTPDHREIFGPESEAALFFSTAGEAVEKLHGLTADDGLRQRLAQQGRCRVASGANSWDARLRTMVAGQAPKAEAC